MKNSILNKCIIILLALCTFQIADAQVTNGVLYAISGAGGTASNLYTIDPATGTATLVGSTGLTHMTGLASDPTTGILYAWQNVSFSDGKLYTIDPTTAAVTQIGAFGHPFQIPDIAFNSVGVLYGWTESGDDLVTIDITTGVPTVVGQCGCGTARTGIAFNSTDQLYMKDHNSIHLMNAATGTIISSVNYGSPTLNNALAFSDTDIAYTINRPSGASSPNYDFVEIDVNTGAQTVIGSGTIPGLSALAFGVSLVTVPTLGQWGLIILALLLLNLGLIAINVPVLETSTGERVTNWRASLQFNLKDLMPYLFYSALALVSIFAIAIFGFEYMATTADPWGCLVSLPLIAYLSYQLLSKKTA